MQKKDMVFTTLKNKAILVDENLVSKTGLTLSAGFVFIIDNPKKLVDKLLGNDFDFEDTESSVDQLVLSIDQAVRDTFEYIKSFPFSDYGLILDDYCFDEKDDEILSIN